MTGRLRLGKISTGIRFNARIEQRATPMTATMTLIGRRMARLISHILLSPLDRCVGHLLKEWLQVASHSRSPKQRAPNAQSSYRVVDLGLRQKALGFGDFGGVRQ